MGIFKNTRVKTKQQRGAASIFVVIFFALLVGVVTISFVRIISNDRQQAINNDLSQSAYDAAQAGVEDSKRVLEDCLNKASAGDCDPNTKFTGSDCYSFNQTLTTKEVKIGGETFNQAHTCVKIKYATNNVEGVLGDGDADIYPLPAGVAEFTLSWFNEEDAGGQNINLTGDANSTLAAWGPNKPSLIRAQVISADKTDRKISNIDSRAVFLYPSKALSATNTSSISSADEGRSGNNPTIVKAKTQPVKVKCEDSLTPGGNNFACSIKIMGVDSSKENYLIIQPYYKKAHYSISLPGGAVFDGIQPEIDSTGRTSDVFRRVKTRVTRTPPPSASTGIYNFNSAGSICKNFGVTNNQFKDIDPSCPTKIP